MGWPGSLNNLMILKILNRSVKHFFVMRLCPSVFIKHTLLTFKVCNDGVGFLPFMFSSLNCVKYSRNKLIYFLFLWDNPPSPPHPKGGGTLFRFSSFIIFCSFCLNISLEYTIIVSLSRF